MSNNKKFKKVMGEWKAGTLKSSSGDTVKYPSERKRALAIAFSESGQSNPKHDKGGVAETPKTKKRLGNKIKSKEKTTLYSFFGGFLRKSHGSVFPPFPNVDMDWTDDKAKVEKLYNEAGLNYFDKNELQEISDVAGVLIFEIKSIEVPKEKWENRKVEARKNGYGDNWNEMLNDEVNYDFKEVRERAIHLDGEIVGKNELQEYLGIMRKGGKIKTVSMKAWGLTEQEWNWREKMNEKLKKSKGEEHTRLMKEYNESDVAKKIRNKMLNNDMVKEKGGEIHTEVTDGEELVFKADTKGGKYSIEIVSKENIHGKYYDINEYKNGRTTGGGNRNTKEDMIKWLKQTLQGSRDIDGINYIISVDKLGIGSYAKGGEIYNENDLKKVLVTEYNVYPEYAISYIEYAANLHEAKPSLSTKQIMDELEKTFPQLTYLKNNKLSPQAKEYAESLRNKPMETGGKITELQKRKEDFLQDPEKYLVLRADANGEWTSESQRKIDEFLENINEQIDGKRAEIQGVQKEIDILKEAIEIGATDEDTKNSMKAALKELNKKIADLTDKIKTQRNVTIPSNKYWVDIEKKKNYDNIMRNWLDVNKIKRQARTVNGKYRVFVDDQETLNRVVSAYNMKRVKGKDAPVSASDISGKSENGGKLWDANAEKKEGKLRNKARRMGLISSDDEPLTEKILDKIENENENLKEDVEIVRKKKRLFK